MVTYTKTLPLTSPVTIYLISVAITENIPCLLITLIKNHFQMQLASLLTGMKRSHASGSWATETECFIHGEYSGLYLTPVISKQLLISQKKIKGQQGGTPKAGSWLKQRWPLSHTAFLEFNSTLAILKIVSLR